MLRLAADENFNNGIIRGLLRRKPDLDIACLQDVGLSGAADAMALEWCAKEGGNIPAQHREPYISRRLCSPSRIGVDK